jgi:uncharacterized membrane protein YdbT with pleckstrin-like domain
MPDSESDQGQEPDRGKGREGAEETVLVFHPSWRGMVGWYVKWSLAAAVLSAASYFIFSTGIFALVLLASFGVVVGLGYAIRACVTYKVTTKRVFEHRGIINRKYESAFFSQITNTVVDQSLGERLLGIGHLSFDTAGERNVTDAISHRRGAEQYLNWWGVRHPRRVEETIDELRLRLA